MKDGTYPDRAVPIGMVVFLDTGTVPVGPGIVENFPDLVNDSLEIPDLGLPVNDGTWPDKAVTIGTVVFNDMGEVPVGPGIVE